jgi:hypothetical protein
MFESIKNPSKTLYILPGKWKKKKKEGKTWINTCEKILV